MNGQFLTKCYRNRSDFAADLIECLWLLIWWQEKGNGKLGKHLLCFWVIMVVEIQSLWTTLAAVALILECLIFSLCRNLNWCLVTQHPRFWHWIIGKMRNLEFFCMDIKCRWTFRLNNFSITMLCSHSFSYDVPYFYFTLLIFMSCYV